MLIVEMVVVLPFVGIQAQRNWLEQFFLTKQASVTDIES
ncbi:hypothetical protein SLGD_01603 [Staphylococcus lugdunensis HKU09-01]|nr:hypothetical protein SLGD_01603 [Staphylococcus lugdunensis HKU09-01]CCB54096.1 hypothetical protein SLUG_16050 [Staphylococcus lugdunensis N920143]